MTTEMHPLRWGDPARATSLPDGARALVEAVFGPAPQPAPAHEATGTLPPVGLAGEVLAAFATVVGDEHVSTDDDLRRRRTRGKSTTDLLRARAGDLDDAPDAVVRPASHDEVADVLAVAVARHVAVVPFGGGTCVTGGLAARREGFAGVVSLDLGRLTDVEVDPVSMTATLGPGLRGPDAEARLAEHGLTIGHFPQSFEHASIGGFAATRSSGQASAGYGRFDALVVGLTVATPTGTMTLGTAPANAAGPDLRQLVLGSEGAFGVITSVTVRVRAVPEVTTYDGWRWSSFAEGVAALRTLAQSGLRPTVLRLSDESESAVNLADPNAIAAGNGGGCLMVVGYEGSAARVEAERSAATDLLERLGGTNLGEEPGRAWEHGRFAAPYLRDSMLDLGVLVETLETATFWSGVDRLYADVKAALERVLGAGGAPALVLCHVSHVYETGCSLYFTAAARQAGDPVEQWLGAKTAAGDAIVAAGATITHHHAIGTDHQPWLGDEIGAVGVRVLQAVKAELDPTGVLNPGVLVPTDD